MNVFISWSGPRAHAVALALREWLPTVIQRIDPYVSSEDVRKGQRWAIEIGSMLGESNHGIVCLTPENLDAPWVVFEAGALSKSIAGSALWTLLIGDLESKDVSGPLSQFQHTTTAKDDFFKLVTSINASLADDAIDTERLRKLFEAMWPALRDEIDRAVEIETDEQVGPKRSSEALLEEILELSRNTSKAIGEFVEPSDGFEHRIQEFHTIVYIQPTEDEEKFNAFLAACRSDSRIRRAGVTSTGGGGVGVGENGEGTEYYNFHLQSYRPISRKALEDVAVRVGIDIVDVVYDRRSRSR